jgi:hypothetical protein
MRKGAHAGYGQQWIDTLKAAAEVIPTLLACGCVGSNSRTAAWVRVITMSSKLMGSAGDFVGISGFRSVTLMTRKRTQYGAFPSPNLLVSFEKLLLPKGAGSVPIGVFDLLPTRSESERSWTVPRADIEARNFDLKAVNPHAKSDVDTRTPAELIDLIEAKGAEVSAALAELRQIALP